MLGLGTPPKLRDLLRRQGTILPNQFVVQGPHVRARSSRKLLVLALAMASAIFVGLAVWR